MWYPGKIKVLNWIELNTFGIFSNRVIWIGRKGIYEWICYLSEMWYIHFPGWRSTTKSSTTCHFVGTLGLLLHDCKISCFFLLSKSACKQQKIRKTITARTVLNTTCTFLCIFCSVIIETWDGTFKHDNMAVDSWSFVRWLY